MVTGPVKIMGTCCWSLAFTREMAKKVTGYILMTRTSNDMNSIENDVNGTGVDVRGAGNTMAAVGLSYAF